MSTYERYRLNYNQAFNNAGEALIVAEVKDDSLLKAKAYEELGVLTYLYKQNEESGDYFLKAHKLYKSLYKNGELNISDLYQSHYNLVMHYQRIEHQSYLKAHIDTCYSLSKQFKANAVYNLYLQEKKASLEEWNKNYNKAIKLLESIAFQLENIESNVQLRVDDRRFLLIVYGRISNIYLKLNKLNLAEIYFEKFVKVNGVIGETTFYRSFLYSRYAEVLSKLGKYNKAYEYEQQSNSIGNAYLNPRNDRNKGFLTVKNPYKEQLVKKNEQINIKNLELAKNQEEILRFRILFFTILLILVIVVFLVRSRIRSLKFQKKQEISNELLSIKNKELTSNTLQLIEKEEVIKQLSSYIKESNPDKRSLSLLKSIERSSTSLWDAFNTRFKEQNIGFYARLQKKVPNLSSSDLKLCALIKLNFSGKEMAYLLGISLGSVHVARHRLRKKMNLNREVNLTNFINSI
ncbi:hypothetical protein Q4Q34_01640 [Flavivirga abyssicola]|uniref:helix-turn-helix transcriptional regulator n=1 Tax=Flavivirga abyssicola TaxID=3063533 RepID=UPI0026E0D53B|nr:hypothetical protein [Flavivirga sp. MEBiC07777]WVK13742.1 hypothetical protein Q4Q34_01640 [Flavivirga sp. MEBiC07777]